MPRPPAAKPAPRKRRPTTAVSTAMAAPPLGAHVSVAGGLVNAFANGAALSCGAVQIFVKNGNQWLGKPLAEEEAAAFRAERDGSCVGHLLAHASYLINLCAIDPVLLAKSRQALGDELDRCHRLGVDGLVVHPGAHMGAGEEAGLAAIAASLDAVLAARPGQSTRVLIENTAGQGTCLGHRLEHLAAIRAQAAEPARVGVCIDTCHAFAAGDPLHEPAGYDAFWQEFADVVGWPALGALHLNDSLRPFASRRDRHAHIGKGEIGLDLFARLLHDPRLQAVPMVIETDPEEKMKGHRRDLRALRALRPLPS